MNVTQARDAILGVVKAAWDADATSAPVNLTYDDVREDPPGTDANGNAQPYAVAWVLHSTGAQETIGGQGQGICIHEGYVLVQIYTPAGLGSGLADQLAQIAKRALQGQSFGTGGWFFEVAVVDLARDVKRPVYRHTQVKARFRYEERIGE